MGAIQIELFGGPVPAKISGPSEVDIDEMFDRWYAQYPRHEAKKDARKAFGQVIKAGEGTEDQIIQGTQRYVRAIESRGTTAKHICLPATFLRGGRYNDDFGSRFERGSAAVTQHSSFAHASARFSGRPGIHRRAIPTLHRGAGMVCWRNRRLGSSAF